MKKLILILLLAISFIMPVAGAPNGSAWYAIGQAGANVNLSAGNDYNHESTDTSDNTHIARFWIKDHNGLTVTIESTDWFYNSIANPEYKVPFGLNIKVTPYSKESKPVTEDICIGYEDNGNLNDSKKLELTNFPGNPNYYIIDFYLIVPDAAHNADPSLFNNAGPANDYLALFTVTISDETYTVLSSGYFNSPPAEDSLVFAVIPDASAKNLSIESLLSGESIDVARYEFTTITSEYGNNESPYYIYASSSESFEISTQPFTMTNQGDQTSSFNYNVTLTSNESGTEYSGKFTLGTTTMMQTQTRNETLPDNNNAVTYYDSGIISISIGNNEIPDNLSAGYYSSDIYLHVVSNK